MHYHELVPLSYAIVVRMVVVELSQEHLELRHMLGRQDGLPRVGFRGSGSDSGCPLLGLGPNPLIHFIWTGEILRSGLHGLADDIHK